MVIGAKKHNTPFVVWITQAVWRLMVVLIQRCSTKDTPESAAHSDRALNRFGNRASTIFALTPVPSAHLTIDLRVVES
jgi:hypothetical protein